MKFIYTITTFLAIGLFACTTPMDPEQAPETVDQSSSSAPATETPNADSVDRKKIEAYVKSKNLKGEFTPSGLFIVIEKEGTGAYPTANSMAKADYAGYLLDGTPFDNSKPGNPYEFSLAGGVIQGWLEGFRKFKKGSSGKLIIPSALAYGPNGSGPIPPGAVLVFDVKLVDFK